MPSSERVVPGLPKVPHREFLYVEHDGDAGAFLRVFDELADVAWTQSRPSSGGVITENAVLTVPSGERFFCVSYKGDLQSWRNGLAAGARALGRRTATVDGTVLQASDGVVWPLDACELGEYVVGRRARRRNPPSSGAG